MAQTIAVVEATTQEGHINACIKALGFVAGEWTLNGRARFCTHPAVPNANFYCRKDGLNYSTDLVLLNEAGSGVYHFVMNGYINTNNPTGKITLETITDINGNIAFSTCTNDIGTRLTGSYSDGILRFFSVFDITTKQKRKTCIKMGSNIVEQNGTMAKIGFNQPQSYFISTSTTYENPLTADQIAINRYNLFNQNYTDMCLALVNINNIYNTVLANCYCYIDLANKGTRIAKLADNIYIEYEP